MKPVLQYLFYWEIVSVGIHFHKRVLTILGFSSHLLRSYMMSVRTCAIYNHSFLFCTRFFQGTSICKAISLFIRSPIQLPWLPYGTLGVLFASDASFICLPSAIWLHGLACELVYSSASAGLLVVAFDVHLYVLPPPPSFCFI